MRKLDREIFRGGRRDNRERMAVRTNRRVRGRTLGRKRRRERYWAGSRAAVPVWVLG